MVLLFFLVMASLIVFLSFNYVKRKNQAEKLYQQAYSLYNEQCPDYIEIINIMTKATQLFKKNEYLEFLSNIKQLFAKNLYQQAKEEYKKQKPNYVVSIDLMKQVNNLVENRVYSAFLKDVEHEYEKKKEVTDKLYQQAEKEYKATKPNYIKIITLIEEAINILELKDYCDFLVTVKSEHEEKKQKAEELYQQAKTLFDEEEPNYTRIIKNIQQAIDIAEKDEYKDLLDTVNAKYEQYKQAETFYQQAKDGLNTPEPDFNKLSEQIQKAINILDKKIYRELSETIKAKQEQCKQSENFYLQAKELFNEPEPDLDRLTELIQKAIDTYDKKEYRDFLDKIHKKYKKFIKAEALYNQAKELLNEDEPDFAFIQEMVYEAIDVVEKEKYLILLDEIDIKYENYKKAEMLFKRAKTSYNKIHPDYAQIKIILQQALDFYEKEEYKTLLDTVSTQYEQFTQAENLYEKANDLYIIKDNINYDEIIKLLKQALSLREDIKYSNFLKAVKKEQQAETIYTEAINLYDKNEPNFDTILNLMKEATDLYSSPKYKSFIKKITEEYPKKYPQQYSEKLFKQAQELSKKSSPQYNRIIEITQNAINIYKKQEYIDFIEEMIHEQRQNLTLIANDPMITSDWRDF